jgi:hypothetical protein
MGVKLEVLTLTLREELGRVLRRILEPKRDEIMGGLRKLYNEELHNLYSSLNIVRMMKSWRAGRVACMGRRTAYRILMGKPEGKRSLGAPRRRRG